MPEFECTASKPAEVEADQLALFAIQGEDGPELGEAAAGVDAATDGALSDFLNSSSFKGEHGESRTFPGRSGTAAPLVLLVGVGRSADLTLQRVREAAASIARKSKKTPTVATDIHLLKPSGVSGADVLQAAVEGFGLGSYEFLKYKFEPKPTELAKVVLAECEDSSGAVERGCAVADAVNWARDLVNEPAGGKSPHEVAEVVRAKAKEVGISCEVWDEERIARENLGGVLGVCAGSVNAPRFVRLEYKPKDPSAPLVALAGKGVCFDSGGLSLKPAEAMETMKTDMSGAAAVAAAMTALPALAPEVHVIGYIPFVENMPSGSATKPGDVLRFRNNKTAEVMNTDAEGRLILADALSLASEEKPEAIVDLATLTGACMVALGPKIFGVMGNDEELENRIVECAGRSGEKGWRLPLPDEYKKQIESEIAHIKNIGQRYGGALTAGLFLKEFVAEGIPWAHLDIAGPARSESEEYEVPKGGTGVGVRTILEWITSYRN